MLMISCRTLTHVRFDLFRKYLLIDKEIINYLGKVSYIYEGNTEEENKGYVVFIFFKFYQ